MHKYETKITCPDHLTHQATLYTLGHEYAGIWECDIDKTADVCFHEDSHVEYDETWPQSPFGIIFSIPYLVCDLCGCPTEEDITDEHLIEQDCAL